MTDENLKGVEGEIRSWARRPPDRSPAAARTRVLARLEQRPRRAAWRLLPVGALVVVGLAIAALFVGLRLPLGGSPDENGLADAQRPVSHMLVVELSSGTTLYFPLATQSLVQTSGSSGTLLGDG